MGLILLHHGTTRRRAERIVTVGPDPNYIEPGGDRYSRAEGFSTALAPAADLGLGSAEEYARRKARNFPTEGGPVILEVEVPDGIVDIVRTDPWSRLGAGSGDIRFEPGTGLEELLLAWPTLTKRIIPV